MSLGDPPETAARCRWTQMHSETAPATDTKHPEIAKTQESARREGSLPSGHVHSGLLWIINERIKQSQKETLSRNFSWVEHIDNKKEKKKRKKKESSPWNLCPKAHHSFSTRVAKPSIVRKNGSSNIWVTPQIWAVRSLLLRQKIWKLLKQKRMK